MSEVWLPIPLPGWDRYEVSSAGNVRFAATGRVRKVVLDRGYPIVRAAGAGTRRVHRLVALTFLGVPPPGMEVCHNDGDPTNNGVSNLRYDTKASNAADRRSHGTDPNARKSTCPAGHPYDEVNTYVAQRRNGHAHRLCRACNRAAVARYKARRQAVAA